MNDQRSYTSRRVRLTSRKLVRYFMSGVLITAPILITFFIIRWLFMSLDGLLRPFINVPGLGFVVVILTILLIGWIGSVIFVGQIFKMVDRGLESLPGISFIYTSVRDFLKAFVGSKQRFTHTVRVSPFSDDVWLLGFLTDDDLKKFELGEEYVSVYVPQSYNIAGQLYLVTRDRVHHLEEIRARDAMRYAATGGAVMISEKVDGTAISETSSDQTKT